VGVALAVAAPVALAAALVHIDAGRTARTAEGVSPRTGGARSAPRDTTAEPAAPGT